MKKVIFLDTLTSTARSEWLKCLREVLIDNTLVLPEQIDEHTANEIDIAIVANPNPADLLRYPNLLLVQSVWSGVEKLVDALKSEAFRNSKIRLSRLIDPALSTSMAESVLTWTLYLQRNIPTYIQQQHSRHWHPLPNVDSKHLRVSFLGAGQLSLTSMALLSNLDYKLSCWSIKSKSIEGVDHFVGQAGLDVMLKQTDILINLLPLTHSTHHLLNREKLGLLPVGAKLINFSRGDVIYTPDLIELISCGHLSHAVLDVFEKEPLPSTSQLWCNPNITVLPHISALTNKKSASAIVAGTIHAFTTLDQWPECVDLNRGY